MMPVLILAVMSSTMGWVLPPSKFISDFSHFYSRLSVIHYTPNNSGEGLSSAGNYIRSLSYGDLSVCLHNQYSANLKLRNDDLVVYIIDENDTATSVSILKNIFSQRLRTNLEFWLIDISALASDNDTLNVEIMQDIQFDLNDDIFFYSYNYDTADIINIWEVYKIDPFGKLIISNHAKWSANKGLRLQQNVSKWIRRSDLQGHHFDVVTSESTPYIQKMTPLGNGSFKMTGLYAEVFTALKEVMNFTYTVRQAPNNIWGSLQSDKSWNGMVGLLAYQKVDIAVTDFTSTLARSAVISFSTTITQVHNSMFIKNPAGAYNLKAYTETFHYILWAALAIFFITIPPILFLIMRQGQQSIAMERFSLAKSYSFLSGSLIMHGWATNPKTTATKVAFLCISFSGMLFYWHWEAMLISQLAIRVTVLPFNSIEQMVQSEYRLYVSPGSANEDDFKYSRDTIKQEAWTKKIEPYLEEYKAYMFKRIELVRNDPTVTLYGNFYGFSTYPEYVNCEFVAIPAKYGFISNAYGFQKYSPYLDIFNYFIIQLKESGSYKKINIKYVSKPQICPDYSGKSLGFNSCVTMFLVILMGLGLGFLFLLIECHLKYFIPDLNWFNSNPPAEESLEVQELQLEVQQLKQELRLVQNV